MNLFKRYIFVISIYSIGL